MSPSTNPTTLGAHVLAPYISTTVDLSLSPPKQPSLNCVSFQYPAANASVRHRYLLESPNNVDQEFCTTARLSCCLQLEDKEQQWHKSNVDLFYSFCLFQVFALNYFICSLYFNCFALKFFSVSQILLFLALKVLLLWFLLFYSVFNL